MLSYQHIYHAGNFSDVHKHALLVRTLQALKNKAPRLFALDTHAGRGLYDLTDDEAQKNQEFKNGISALWDQETGVSPVSLYLECIRKHNPGGALDIYPGSAQFAKDVLRDADRLVFAELHSGEFEKLRDNFEAARNVEVLQMDGFRALLEKTPPPERKGIAVIDPSYEIKSDYGDLPRHVGNAFRKWPQGVYFIWYPILSAHPHLQMLSSLRGTDVKDVLVSEIKLEKMPAEGFAMYGSGIAIVNSPLPEAAVREISSYIAEHLSAKASADVFWLDNQKIDPDTGILRL